MVWEGIQTSGFRDILGRLAGWCPKQPLSQHFRICEAEYVLTDISVHLKLCVPHPTKHKTCANRLRNRPFWQRFGKPSKLRISTHSGTSGWLESENAFKPTFSSLGGWVGLRQPFHVADFEASETRNRRKGWFKHLYEYWALGPQPIHCLSWHYRDVWNRFCLNQPFHTCDFVIRAPFKQTFSQTWTN